MRLRLPLLLAPIALSACGESATTVEFAKLCVKELDGKTVATVGYLQAPFLALCRSTTRRRSGTTTTCSFDLRDKPDGAVRVSLNIQLGSGSNRVDEARLKARQGSAAIKDDDAKFLADKMQVRVTGTLGVAPNAVNPEQSICWIDVDRIERR